MGKILLGIIGIPSNRIIEGTVAANTLNVPDNRMTMFVMNKPSIR
jgi:hypothetical protein